MIALIILAIIILIYLFFVFPSVRKHKDLRVLKGSYIAHRGLHNKEKSVPENSLLAFAEAAANGYAIENDIRLTADGKVVVFHDDSLSRMCSQEGLVIEKTLDELKSLRLLDTDEQIPTLKECLDLVDGRVPLLIEFKCGFEDYEKLCVAANEVLRGYNGKYFIQSFNPLVLSWYRKNRKDILRGQLAQKYNKKGFVAWLVSGFFMNFVARPDFVAYNFADSKAFCFKLQKLLGAFPVAWTFHTQQQIDKKKQEIKAYIFECFIPKK